MGKSVCTPRSDSKATGSKEAIGSGVKGTKSSWRNEFDDLQRKNCSESVSSKQIKLKTGHKQLKIHTLNELKYMYTNLDTFCNKKPELLMRIAEWFY